ncbi:MAG: monofunctional biosynthetic peptidoglycan transglycosylase [Bacteroidales bacterium]|nr:monofunctional biosynthetic peptidoglycan transglycosylase [Bacteroidales bacterium]
MSQTGESSRFQRVRKYIFRKIKFCLIFFFASSIVVTLLYRFLPPPVTPLMMIRVIENISDSKKPTINKHWVPMSDISPNLVLAVIASEDNNFESHYGVDFKAIEKAQKLNKRSKKIRGASTITQQTAKNVYLWQARTYVRKGLELYFTGLIEILWGKKRIMEMYLNVIEMGDGIYGAEAASQYYFHKSAKNLTRDEAASIAAVLPNPRRWRPDKPTAYVSRTKSRIIWAMNRVERPDWLIMR